MFMKKSSHTDDAVCIRILAVVGVSPTTQKLFTIPFGETPTRVQGVLYILISIGMRTTSN